MKAALHFILLTAAISALEISAFSRLPTTVSRRPNELLPRAKQVSSWQPYSRSAPRCLQMKSTQSEKASSLLIKLASSPVGALIVLLFVVLFHESGHYLAARSVGIHPEEFSIGFGPKLLGFRVFGDDFNLRAVPFGGYVGIPAEQLLPLPWQKRVLISSAGVFFNFLLAFLIYLRQILNSGGLPQLVFDQGVLVTGIAGPDAAASGMLNEGDVIVKINGKPISMPSKSPTSGEAERAISRAIDKIQAIPEGQTLQLSIRRPNKSNPVDVSVTPKRVTSELTGKLGPPTIGVFIEPNVLGVELVKSDSVLEAAALALPYVFAVTKETAIGLLTFAGDFISGKAGTSEYRVSGPVGVIERASRVVATQDWDTVLKYAAAINVNLGVINFLPVPPLDGFQIVIVLAEALWSQITS